MPKAKPAPVKFNSNKLCFAERTSIFIVCHCDIKAKVSGDLFVLPVPPRPIKRMERQIVSAPPYKVLIRAACLMMMALTKGTKVIKGCRVLATRARPALLARQTTRYVATRLRAYVATWLRY